MGATSKPVLVKRRRVKPESKANLPGREALSQTFLNLIQHHQERINLLLKMEAYLSDENRKQIDLLQKCSEASIKACSDEELISLNTALTFFSNLFDNPNFIKYQAFMEAYLAAEKAIESIAFLAQYESAIQNPVFLQIFRTYAEIKKGRQLLETMASITEEQRSAMHNFTNKIGELLQSQTTHQAEIEAEEKKIKDLLQQRQPFLQELKTFLEAIASVDSDEFQLLSTMKPPDPYFSTLIMLGKQLIHFLDQNADLFNAENLTQLKSYLETNLLDYDRSFSFHFRAPPRLIDRASMLDQLFKSPTSFIQAWFAPPSTNVFTQLRKKVTNRSPMKPLAEQFQQFMASFSTQYQSSLPLMKSYARLKKLQKQIEKIQVESEESQRTWKIDFAHAEAAYQQGDLETLNTLIKVVEHNHLKVKQRALVNQENEQAQQVKETMMEARKNFIAAQKLFEILDAITDFESSRNLSIHKQTFHQLDTVLTKLIQTMQKHAIGLNLDPEKLQRFIQSLQIRFHSTHLATSVRKNEIPQLSRLFHELLTDELLNIHPNLSSAAIQTLTASRDFFVDEIETLYEPLNAAIKRMEYDVKHQQAIEIEKKVEEALSQNTHMLVDSQHMKERHIQLKGRLSRQGHDLNYESLFERGGWEELAKLQREHLDGINDKIEQLNSILKASKRQKAHYQQTDSQIQLTLDHTYEQCLQFIEQPLIKRFLSDHPSHDLTELVHQMESTQQALKQPYPAEDQTDHLQTVDDLRHAFEAQKIKTLDQLVQLQLTRLQELEQTQQALEQIQDIPYFESEKKTPVSASRLQDLIQPFRTEVDMLRDHTHRTPEALLIPLQQSDAVYHEKMAATHQQLSQYIHQAHTYQFNLQRLVSFLKDYQKRDLPTTRQDEIEQLINEINKKQKPYEDYCKQVRQSINQDFHHETEACLSQVSTLRSALSKIPAPFRKLTPFLQLVEQINQVEETIQRKTPAYTSDYFSPTVFQIWDENQSTFNDDIIMIHQSLEVFSGQIDQYYHLASSSIYARAEAILYELEQEIRNLVHTSSVARQPIDALFNHEAPLSDPSLKTIHPDLPAFLSCYQSLYLKLNQYEQRLEASVFNNKAPPQEIRLGQAVLHILETTHQQLATPSLRRKLMSWITFFIQLLEKAISKVRRSAPNQHPSPHGFFTVSGKEEIAKLAKTFQEQSTSSDPETGQNQPPESKP